MCECGTVAVAYVIWTTNPHRARAHGRPSQEKTYLCLDHLVELQELFALHTYEISMMEDPDG